MGRIPVKFFCLAFNFHVFPFYRFTYCISIMLANMPLDSDSSGIPAFIFGFLNLVMGSRVFTIEAS